MSLSATRPRLSPEETQERILVVAEDLFRRVGYAKTSVADIAAQLSMSPANVYRFFPSKGAINEAICGRFIAEADALVDRIADGDLPPAERIVTLIVEHHRFNRSNFVAERRVFDMVEVAMAENWPTIERHMGHVSAALARCVAAGVADGSFRPVDPLATAITLKKACMMVIHPTMIALCADQDLETVARDIVALCVRGLAAPTTTKA